MRFHDYLWRFMYNVVCFRLKKRKLKIVCLLGCFCLFYLILILVMETTWMMEHITYIHEKITKLGCPFQDPNKDMHGMNVKRIIIIGKNDDINYEDTKRCEYKNCVFTYDVCDHPRSDAVVYHAPSTFLKEPHRRLPGQVFVFWSLEPPIRHGSLFRGTKWRNYFNWTLTYRRDSDITHAYAQFILQDNNKNKRRFSNLSNIVTSKSKSIAWFVSNCQTESRREYYVEVLQKYVKVDIYGKCGPLKCASKRDRWDCLKLLNEYQFYLAFENSLCRDYVSEKQIYTAYKSSFIIPVTRGDSHSHLYKPPNSYIDTSKFSSVKELADFLKRVAADDKIYKSYFDSRKNFVVDEGSPSMCELCRRLNHAEKYQRVYDDIYNWERQINGVSVCDANPNDFVEALPQRPFGI